MRDSIPSQVCTCLTMGPNSPPPDPPPSTTTTTTEQTQLRQSITSLIADSHCIRVFPSKWHPIRLKLAKLNTLLHLNLIIISNSNNSTMGIPILSDLMSSIDECRDLVDRCIRVTYVGKLLMQSELDKLGTKLDTHLRNLVGFYTAAAEVNYSSVAIVVSRPRAGAKKEEVRFYVNDLVTRLRIGNVVMRKEALVCLNGVVVEDDEKYVRVLEEMNGGGDMTAVLLRCVNEEEEEGIGVREEAVRLVAVMMARFESIRVSLVGVGIVGALVRVLENGSLRGKGFAVECLMKLTENGDNAWALSAHGGVTALLDVCRNGDPAGGLVGNACRVLRNVVGVEEIKRFMIEEGAVLTFIRLVRSTDELTQIGSIEFLQGIANGDELIGEMIVRQGGIHELIRVFDPMSSCSSYKSRETALRAIENMCFSSMDSFNLLVNYGFMDQLLYFIRLGDTSIQELSLKAAFRLTGISEEAKKVMGDAGFIQEFVKFLEAKSYEVREMAAEAIASMVVIPKNRKKFVQEDKNIGLVLHLIDPNELTSGNLKFLLSILLTLSGCKSARKTIINSGCMKNIEKLAGDGVSDAKKIMRNLSTNKFHAILNKLLHS